MTDKKNIRFIYKNQTDREKLFTKRFGGITVCYRKCGE